MNYFIHPSAVVAENVTIEDGTHIWHDAQIREGAVIGQNCNIGKGVYIDKDVKIGNSVKIQNYVSVYNGVTIEDDVILAPNCTFTNDLYPRAFNKDWRTVPTLVKKGASIGANATILCGVTIGEYSLIGIGSVVTADTLPFSLMVGNPARMKNFVCRCGAELFMEKKDDFNLFFKCKKCSKTLRLNFVME